MRASSSIGGYIPLKPGKPTTRMGDAVSDWNGDGAFARGDNHLTNKNQTTLFKLNTCCKKPLEKQIKFIATALPRDYLVGNLP